MNNELPLYVRIAIIKGVNRMMQNLDDELQKQPFSLEEARDVYAEIVGVMDYIRTQRGFNSYARLLERFEPLQQRYLALKESLKTE
ncbi:hypothetical protein JQN58_05055 [Aneurinibacillus sp. BA2021]|nr:hypothetical protein [Aneurinibacillus sp. BA2021]